MLHKYQLCNAFSWYESLEFFSVHWHTYYFIPCRVHVARDDGKVRHDSMKCTTAFLYSDWLYFLMACHRVFSLTCPEAMQIYWNKRKCLHKKRVELPQDWFGTLTWPPFYCFDTPTWLLWHHVKTLFINIVKTYQIFSLALAKMYFFHVVLVWRKGFCIY